MKRSDTWSLPVLAILLLGAPALARADSWSAAPNRPQGFSVGIGGGWTLPADVLTLNTAGVRFRLPCGLTLEPRIQASRSSSTIDVGGVETETVQRQVAATASARYPVIRRGRTDFVLVGGAAYGWSKYDPWDTNNTTTSQNLSLIWGIAVDYWINPHWALSANASNPLLSMSWQTDQHNDTDSTSTTIGAIFDPSVVIMVHLFY